MKSETYVIIRDPLNPKVYDLYLGDKDSGAKMWSSKTIKKLIEKVPPGNRIFRHYVAGIDNKTGYEQLR